MISLKPEGRVVYILRNDQTIGYFDAPPNSGNPNIRFVQHDTTLGEHREVIDLIAATKMPLPPIPRAGVRLPSEPGKVDLVLDIGPILSLGWDKTKEMLDGLLPGALDKTVHRIYYWKVLKENLPDPCSAKQAADALKHLWEIVRRTWSSTLICDDFIGLDPFVDRCLYANDPALRKQHKPLLDKLAQAGVRLKRRRTPKG